jgi:hypothetical protein
MADCCTSIARDLSAVSTESKALAAAPSDHIPKYAIKYPIAEMAEALIDLWRLPPTFIPLPGAAQDPVPDLAQMLQALGTPLNAGFGQWEWYNLDQPGKTVLTLPQAPTKASVSLNGARLAMPRDYTIAGTTLTLIAGLDVGDHIRVNSYGA